MLCEVLLKTSESESRTDSDNEDDINQLDNSGEVSTQSSSDQEECIKGNCNCRPKTINVISQDQELVLDILRKLKMKKLSKIFMKYLRNQLLSQKLRKP